MGSAYGARVAVLSPVFNARAAEVVVARSLDKHFRSNLVRTDTALINSGRNNLTDWKGESGWRHYKGEGSEYLDSLVKCNFKECYLCF